MVRTPCCEEMGLKKGPWTPEEDQILISYIQKFGHANWRALPKQAGLQRCGKSCRLRWTNYLRPDIKRGNFSKEEEETIIKLHQILGNRWSSIAAKLPGRTDNEIKNFWHTHLKKKLQRSTTPTTTTTTTTSTGLILSKLHPININISINNSTTNPVHRIAQSISTSTTIPIVAEPAVQSHIMSSSHVEEPSSITKEEGTGRTVLLSTRDINIDHHDGKKYLLPKEFVEAKTNKYSSTTALFGPKFQISLNSESSSMDQMYTMNKKKSSGNDNNGLSSKNIINNEDMDFWYNLLVKAGEGSTTS